jgi:hypothetical protein
MKRKTWQITFLSLLIFCAGAVLYSSSPASIDKILVEPGKFSTKVVLEANAVAPSVRAFYDQESPKTLILELVSFFSSASRSPTGFITTTTRQSSS